MCLSAFVSSRRSDWARVAGYAKSRSGLRSVRLACPPHACKPNPLALAAVPVQEVVSETMVRKVGEEASRCRLTRDVVGSHPAPLAKRGGLGGGRGNGRAAHGEPGRAWPVASPRQKYGRGLCSRCNHSDYSKWSHLILSVSNTCVLRRYLGE